jgi:hypothetical protein
VRCESKRKKEERKLKIRDKILGGSGQRRCVKSKCRYIMAGWKILFSAQNPDIADYFYGRLVYRGEDKQNRKIFNNFNTDQ